MLVIVGLGNPGNEYKRTRHNVGFLFLDELLLEYTKGQTFINRTNYDFCDLNIRRFKLQLIKPLKYMNLSGEVVKKIVSKNTTDDAEFTTKNNLIVVHDDVDLDPGKIKIKNSGGDGGHKGIRNIIEELGHDEFIRIRLGVGKSEYNTADYVLDNFTLPELDFLKQDTFKRAKRFVSEYLSVGYQKAVSRVGADLKLDAATEE